MLLNSSKLRIMEEFLRDYNVKLTGSHIAKKGKLNQKSVSNLLKQLEKENFLKSVSQGKNKLYFFNLEDELTIVSFISCLEYLRSIAFYRKRPFIKEVLSKITIYCDGTIAVFGSYAKGIEKDNSDLDLFVMGKCNLDEIEKISDIYKIEINVKHYPSMLKKSDPLIEEIIKDHIIVTNVQKFIWRVLQWKKSNGALA